MKKNFETFELKIDPAEFIEQQRKVGVDVDNPDIQERWERECVLKSGWAYSELVICHEYDYYEETRIYPDGTCYKIWHCYADGKCGHLNGKLLKPYDELVGCLEVGDSIEGDLKWDYDSYEYDYE